MENLHTVELTFPVVVVVVLFIFRILVQYESFFTRAQGPVIEKKKFKL